MPSRYELNPQPFLPPAIVALIVVAPLAYLIPWLRDVRAGEPPWTGLVLGAAYALLVGIIVGVRYLTWSRVGQVIQLHATHVELPVSAGSRRMRRVPYEDLLSIIRIGAGGRSRLLVAGRTRTFAYSAGQLVGGETRLEALREALRVAVAAGPGGPDQLEAMDERERLGGRLLQVPPRVTLAILLLLIVSYAWSAFGGALDSQFRLVRFGANVPSLVANGEWYRLFSGNFLHAGLLHLYLNGFGIFALGGLLERLVGPWRLTCIYLLSALGGALASAWAARALLSVGASTAVFGLLGSLAVLNWRFRAVLPGGFRQPLRWWVIILAVNALLPIIAPMIDYWAHIGGFAAGALATALACPREQGLPPARVSGPWKVATSTLAIVCLLCLGEAVVRESTASGSDSEIAVARQFIEQEGMGPIELNTFAWQLATQPEVTREELRLAESAAQRAVALVPDESIIDTLATVYYRQGDLDRAVATQARAIARSERRDLFSQMGRFLDARLARSGVLYRGNGERMVAAATIERGRDGAPVVNLELTSTSERGIEVFALERDAQGLRGTVRLVIGPGLPPDRYDVPLTVATGAAPGRTPLTVAYVDASDCGCAAQTLQARYFAMDPSVSRLP